MPSTSSTARPVTVSPSIVPPSATSVQVPVRWCTNQRFTPFSPRSVDFNGWVYSHPAATTSAHSTPKPTTRIRAVRPTGRPDGGENLRDADMRRIVRSHDPLVFTGRGDHAENAVELGAWSPAQ